MTEVLPGNGCQSSLNGAILAADLTLTIQTADVASFPSAGTYRLNLHQDALNGPWEIVTVTGGQGTATLTVTRQSESFRGTQTALDWPDATTKVVPVVTKAALEAGAALTPGTDITVDLGDDTHRLRRVFSQEVVLAGRFNSGALPDRFSLLTDNDGDLFLQASFDGAAGGPGVGLLGVAGSGSALYFVNTSPDGDLANVDWNESWGILQDQPTLGLPSTLVVGYAAGATPLVTFHALTDGPTEFAGDVQVDGSAGFNGATPSQPILATGAGHTVDDIIAALQTLGLVRQS